MSQIKKFWYFWLALLIGSCVLQLLGVFNLAPTDNLFADTRVLCGVHNFFDVVSNIPFLLAGLYGFYINRHQKSLNIFLASLGSICVCMGSSYYHIMPSNPRLLWDRLPISIVFSAIFSLSVIHLKLIDDNKNPNKFSLAYLLFSVATVLIWFLGTVIHINLIAPYVFLQFGGMMLLLTMSYIALSKNRFLAIKILTIILLYALAKLFEYFDFQIFTLTHLMVSGHSIKHIVAALALFVWFYKLEDKKIIHEMNTSQDYFCQSCKI